MSLYALGLSDKVTAFTQLSKLETGVPFENPFSFCHSKTQLSVSSWAAFLPQRLLLCKVTVSCLSPSFLLDVVGKTAHACPLTQAPGIVPEWAHKKYLPKE